jgi:hypothetical protein
MNPEHIVHVSLARRRDGCAGGVEKFAWYLERAIGCRLVVDHELPGLLSTLPRNSLLITDGGHGLEIPDSIPILSVCHGTWVGVWARWGWTPEMEGYVNAPYEESQVAMWGNHDHPGKPNTLPVACSSGAKRELVQYHARFDSPTLLHGIDHDVYIPRKTTNTRPKIIHVANEWRKGHHIIPELQSRLPQFDFEFLNAGIGEEPDRFIRGDMYIHISCSEGNSYACLEAMSCNLPMVVTNVGLFEKDVGGEVVGKVIPFYSTVDQMAEAIIEVWESRGKFNPRDWIIRNATFEKFKERWEKLIRTAELFGLN